MAASETFPAHPPTACTRRSRPRVLKATFGDGYGQRAADGLNPVPRTFEVSWTGYSNALIDEMDDFLEARGGHEAFNWTPPLGGGPAGQFTCEDFARSPRVHDWSELTATFVEVFDL